MLKKIATDKAPGAIGPYSQAIVCGDMVYTSGQIALNPQTGNIEGNDIVPIYFDVDGASYLLEYKGMDAGIYVKKDSDGDLNEIDQRNI